MIPPGRRNPQQAPGKPRASGDDPELKGYVAAQPSKPRASGDDPSGSAYGSYEA